MKVYSKNLKIFSGNSNKKLAVKIAESLGVSIGVSSAERFSDGEINLSIGETVRGCDVFVVQSTSGPVNESFMELFIIIDALKRASAERINAVMPYFGYARQDRKVKARDPISAKLVANLLVAAGADRVITMDLHATQIQGFFDIPVDHLSGMSIFCDYYKKSFPEISEDTVVVSPDIGSVKRSRRFAENLNLPLAIVDKRRPKPNESEVVGIIGDIKNKYVIMVDDLIDTAGTLVNAAQAVMERGAKGVYACATHGVLSEPALQRIESSCIEELVVLDTIDLSSRLQGISKIKLLSVAPVFSKAIENIHFNNSVSSLFI